MTFDATVASLLADESSRQREFPVVRERTYLAHAAVCPLPACVVAALGDYLKEVGRGGQFEYLHAAAEAGAREIAAELLGVTPDEIAFTTSTSAGLGLVAGGLDWKPGDNVVFAQGDFPSNVYPWVDLQRRGVEAHPISLDAEGPVTVKELMRHVDGRTRLVALSSVHFVTGARLDVDEIGAALRSRGILFCVDAIQSLGAMPLSARQVDFLTADAHKWLLGPQGIGILFVRRSRFDSLHPAAVGWKSVVANKDFSRSTFELPDSARRYEPGSLNALGLTGLHAALSLLRKVGVDNIGRRLDALRAVLVPALIAKGYQVVGVSGSASSGASEPGSTSGITSFRAASDALTTALQKQLDERRIVVSLREDPSGRKCIRVAPHFYTSDAEIEALLDAV